MDCLSGAAEDQQAGVVLATHTKYAGAWNNWVVWLKHIGAGPNTHLRGLTQTEKIRCMCAFMYAIRRGDFSPTGDKVAGKTAKTAVDNVAATITSSGGSDPRLDNSGSSSLLLDRQLRGYKKVDPKTKHQKAIPPEVYRFLLRRAFSPRTRALIELLCGNLFSGSRSCEYSKTQRHDEKQTPTTRPCDVIVIKNNSRLPYNHPKLHEADSHCDFGPTKSRCAS